VIESPDPKKLLRVEGNWPITAKAEEKRSETSPTPKMKAFPRLRKRSGGNKKTEERKEEILTTSEGQAVEGSE